MARAGADGGGAHPRGTGNTTGGARLLRRGADEVERWAASATPPAPGGLDTGGVVAWARALADRVDAEGQVTDAAAQAPELRARH